MMRLDLEPDIFVLRPLGFLRWFRRPIQTRYEAVAEASLRTEFPPNIRLHLTNVSEGTIWITTPNEGVLKLADRLEERGVPLRDSARSRTQP